MKVEVNEEDLTIPAGHTEVIDEAVAATCTATGLTEGKHCSVCNEVLVAQETVAKVQHTYSGLVSKKAATCTEDGWKKDHYRCTVCQKYFIEKDGQMKVQQEKDVKEAALGHNMVTCYDETYHWTACDRDGCTEATEKVLHSGSPVCDGCGQSYAAQENSDTLS